MRNPIIAWLLVSVLALTVVVGGITYYSSTNQAYKAGQQAGQSVGYANGVNDGYKQGYTNGVNDGYKQGYKKGTDDGFSQGANQESQGEQALINQGKATEKENIILDIEGLQCPKNNDGSMTIKYTQVVLGGDIKFSCA